jgi:hypothetical protein
MARRGFRDSNRLLNGAPSVWRNPGGPLQSRTSCDRQNDRATNRIFFERTPNAAVQTVVSVIAEQEKFIVGQFDRPEIAKLTSSWCKSDPMQVFFIDVIPHVVRFRHPGEVVLGKRAEGKRLAVDRDLILANLDDLAWQSIANTTADTLTLGGSDNLANVENSVMGTATATISGTCWRTADTEPQGVSEAPAIIM